jgi:hypothetical protein
MNDERTSLMYVVGLGTLRDINERGHVLCSCCLLVVFFVLLEMKIVQYKTLSFHETP